MYGFLLRPRWILSHVFALVVIILFVNLGFWQLRRLDEVTARNDVIEAVRSEPPAAVGDVLDEVTHADPDVGAIAHRRVHASGTYDDAVLFVDNRSSGGLPGAWALSPLVLADGTVVIVNRGFVRDDGSLGAPPPPSGPVEVVGAVATWSERSCGVRTDAEGTPIGMACPSRATVERALGRSVAPFFVRLTVSDPRDDDEIVAVPDPELDDGPHLSYAIQWFIFALLTSVVYGLILRRVARDREREQGPADARSAREGSDADV